MILQFSGGKDSLAVLHQYRDQIKRVLFSDTGGVFPHMVDFVEKTCERYKLPLTIVRPHISLEEHMDKNGMPSDMVPGGFYKRGLQSALDCCNAMVWEPMKHHLLTSGEKLVLRGQKKCDHHRSIGAEFDWYGIKFINPLWEWTDEQVFAYLREHGVEMAEHYEEINESMDCWACTAHLSHEGADGRLEYTKKHYPDLWPVLQDRLIKVRSIVRLEQQKIDKEMDKLVPKYAGVRGLLEARNNAN